MISSLAPFRCIDNVSTGENGSTSLTMVNKMVSDHMYLVFVRRLNGSYDAYPPYAYLLYMRSQNWRAAIIGEESEVIDKSISEGKLTITFKNTQWVRMVTYQVI